jgi:DNA-binding response OmpR family regulator
MNRILIIDDEPEMLETLKSYLEPRGYEVVTAKDGAEGLAKFEAEKPNLVICDIKMPKKDGFEFLKEIREKKAWVPIIILSVLDDPATVLKSNSLEADYYLSKPMNLEIVLKAVKLMLSLAPLRRR